MFTLIFLTLGFNFGKSFQHNDRYDKNSERDTIDYLIFLDLIEKDYVAKPKLKSDMDLAKERKDIEHQIIKTFPKAYLIRLSDTCVAKFHLDSISRRDQKIIKKMCELCDVTSHFLIIDASWTYLSNSAFDILESEHRTSALNTASNITGTWWRVRTSIYDYKRDQMLYVEDRKYTQWHNRKPMKNFPGIGHRRYFSRALKNLKNFLIELK